MITSFFRRSNREAEPKDEQESIVRKRIGKYIFLNRIGDGAHGIVFKAKSADDGQLVAVKVIYKDTLTDELAQEGLKTELDLLISLRHPNIVKGIEYFSTLEAYYLVMEYVEGGDLFSKLENGKKMKEKEAKTVFRSLLECLAYCHSRRVCHRDLKLDNLLITSAEVLKVCDFGLAHITREDNSFLCRTIVGTEDYTCPEILRNVEYDGRDADMWSAGVILFILLSGYCPFYGRSTREITKKTLRCKYKFPSKFPDQAKDVVRRLLLLEGKARFSASEALKLPWFNESSPIGTTPSELYQAPRSMRISLVESIPNSLDSAAYSLLTTESQTDMTQFGDLQPVSLDRMKWLTVRKNVDEVVPSAALKAIILNVEEIVRAMLHPQTGVELKTRTWRMRIFPSCFSGKEAVSWLSGNLRCSREEAVRLGNAMLCGGLFHHVCRYHGFQDTCVLYYWNSSRSPYSKCLNYCMLSPVTRASLDALAVSRGLLGTLLGLCKEYELDDGSVDLTALQCDGSYMEFCRTTRELQSVHLLGLQSIEEHRAFFANVHNLLRLHALIHISDGACKDDQLAERNLLSYSYMIAGQRVSLRQVCDLLFPPSCELEEDTSPRTPGTTIATLSKTFNSTKHILPYLGNEPLMLFVVSDFTNGSPSVVPLESSDMTLEELRQVAALYVQKVVTLEVESGKIGCSHRVVRFWKRTGLHGITAIVDYLRTLTSESKFSEKLIDMMNHCSESYVIRTVHLGSPDIKLQGRIWLHS